ncbi:GDP-mannose 4,6-dehydratase, partial [Cohnella lubricantis]
LGPAPAYGVAAEAEPAADASGADASGPGGGCGPAAPFPGRPAAIRSVSCDLTDRETVRSLWRETSPDALLHLAGQNAVDRSWREPDLTLAANAMSTAYLLEAMRAGGGGARALIVGSMLREPVESPSHPYAYSKSVQASASIAWHRWYGLPVVVAEPSNLIGPGGSAGLCGRIARWATETEAAERAMAGASEEQAERGILAVSGSSACRSRPDPFRLSSLTERRDYLDVRDAAAAYELLLLHGTPGACYAIESGKMRSLREVKAAFEQLSTAELQWEISEGAALAPSPAPRDCSPIRTLGWRPSIPFPQSIADALRAERERISLTPEGGNAGC